MSDHIIINPETHQLWAFRLRTRAHGIETRHQAVVVAERGESYGAVCSRAIAHAQWILGTQDVVIVSGHSI